MYVSCFYLFGIEMFHFLQTDYYKYLQSLINVLLPGNFPQVTLVLSILQKG